MTRHDPVAARCMRVIVAWWFAAALAVPAVAAAARPPAVLFTDLPSGPVSGGPHGLGAPIAIFGSGFGAARGTSTVTIGGVEVASYLVWGEHNAHNPTLDLIVVEPGPAVTGGAVVVTVGGTASTSPVVFAAAPGEVYVVATTGSDAAPCRLASPCRSIAHVVTNLMRPGDVVLVRGGDYDEGEIWIRHEYGHSGTAARPKAVTRFPGEEVLLSNGARPFIIDADYITVSGLAFANGKSIVLGYDAPKRQGHRLVDSTFTGDIGFDAVGIHGDDHVVAGNVCRVSSSTVGTQGHCFYVSYGSRNRLLHNIGHGAPGYGIHVFDQRRQANDFRRVIADLVLDGNIVSGSTERSGMILAMGDEDGLGNVIDGVVIRNNLFVGNNHTGLVVNEHVRNVQIVNNTFYQNGRAGLYVASTPTVSGLTIQNNLFEQSPNTNCRSNCTWFSDAAIEVGGLAQSVSIGRNFYTPAVVVIGGVDTDPRTGALRFADAAALDFRPLAGSAVIDNGLTLANVPADYTGLPRPQGAGYDIGAFEYDAVPPPSPAALLLGGTVDRATVTLGWTATGMVLGPYDLEGRAHANGPVVATARVAASPVVVPGVADGVYYVRVAGTAPAGTRVVSNQARVVVGAGCELPETPAAFAAAVNGPLVQFVWTFAGSPATVELAAGYGPGRTDIGPVDVGVAPLTVSAPPGRYFVRARTRNACGASLFTADVEVRVGNAG